jgi:hypothetical protein
MYVFIDCIFWTDHISLYKLDLSYLSLIITNHYYVCLIVETHFVLCLLLSNDKFYIHSGESLEYGIYYYYYYYYYCCCCYYYYYYYYFVFWGVYAISWECYTLCLQWLSNWDLFVPLDKTRNCLGLSTCYSDSIVSFSKLACLQLYQPFWWFCQFFSQIPSSCLIHSTSYSASFVTLSR